ncbi:RagB/SusD family nutrient uptake outer membrane protein [Saccharicrinis sp. FJH54]|uniref:RagB/SusD family nutrient uptake outer membrane protein n=1 Tax=Saccharicrinis sp. FJH54 TaxID=3344665 RepID=UPI0035D3DB3E
MKFDRIYRKPVAIAVMLLLMITSCNDWMTLMPEDELLKENFWGKTEDVYSALGAMYNAFRDASMENLIWGELRADLMVINDISPFQDYARIAESNISPTNGAVSWRHYYKAINLANTLMYYDKEVFEIDETFTKRMMDGVDAEALFIRSLSYFYLVRLWKDVPLVIEPTLSDTADMFIPKSSEREVLNQVIKDLLKAKDMAYTTEFFGSNAEPGFRTGRANKYAIMALLADVYLWDEQYRLASDYCDSVIASGLYDLEPADNWFSLYYPGNSKVESIFEIQYDDNLDYQENPIYNDLIPLTGGAKIRPDMQQLTLLLSEQDIRTCNPSSPRNPDPLRKYKSISIETGIPRSQNQRDANFMYYRYADITLIKAEALNELDDVAGANEWLRKTKERANLSHSPVDTKEDLRTAILEERAKEFLAEGKRWFDVLRVAKRNSFEQKQLIISMILAGADIKQKPILQAKVYDTLSYYLPIPEGDIRTNPNLIQNPYYDR